MDSPTLPDPSSLLSRHAAVVEHEEGHGRATQDATRALIEELGAGAAGIEADGHTLAGFRWSEALVHR